MNIKLWLLVCVSLGLSDAYGQIQIDLDEEHIRTRAPYEQTFLAGTYSGLLNLLPTISVRANTAAFNNETGGVATIPLNRAYVRLESIGNISLINTGNEVALTTGFQVLGSSLANLLSGPVIINIRLPTAGYTWLAGDYNTQIELLAPGLLGIGNRISPATHELNIHVPAFITPHTDVGVTTLQVNDLGYFRASGGIGINKTVTLSTTVPYVPSLQAGQTQFSFSTNLAYNNLPAVAVNTVNASLVGIPNSQAISLSTTAQALTPSAGIPVPNENTQALTTRFAIDGSRLKTSFVQAGTYTVPLTYTWNKSSSSYPAGDLQTQRNGALEVIVSDMGELIANQNTVNLNFSTASDYQNGVVTDMPGHLRISKTTPYNLYVRASSENFASGSSTIPLDVLRIGPAPGEANMQTVTLSTTPQQLIDSSDPVIDRYLNVRYSIPASETGALLGKATGVYSGDIIFSFVAP